MIVTSHVAKCAKPDKAIFEIAAKEAMASDRKHATTLGIEDTDVAGAVAAGGDLGVKISTRISRLE